MSTFNLPPSLTLSSREPQQLTSSLGLLARREETHATMTEPNTSQELSKRNADTALMPPPPAPKRIKRPTKVLDEDVYTDALSHIIARDFFPGLLETQAQQEYLEALDSNNNEWIREAGRRLHQAMTPGPGGRGRRGTSMARTPRRTPTQTPRYTSATPRGWGGDTPRGRGTTGSETPMSTTSSDDRPKQPPVDASLSLGAFQARYTSEDNESFNALLDRQNLKRAQKYAFLHQQPQQAGQKLLQSSSASPSTSTPSDALTLRPSQDLASRPNKIETFTSRQGAANSLMYMPDSIEDSYQTTSQAAAEASLAPPKTISYASTRLPGTSTANTSSTVPASPSLSAIDAAIAGHPRPSARNTNGDGDTDTNAEYYAGAETPRVRGYAFVDAEPTAAELAVLHAQQHGTPVSDAEVEKAEREAAMALMPTLDSVSTGRMGEKGGFKLQTQSRREELHHRMVEKSSLARRSGGAGTGGGTGLGGGGGSDRLGFLKSTGQTPRFLSSPAIPPGLGSKSGGVGTAGAGAGAGGKARGYASLTPAARMLAASLTPVRRKHEGQGSFGGGKGGVEGTGKTWMPTPKGVKKS